MLSIQSNNNYVRKLVYSPNNLLTLLNTLSFSGSYGWSLLGISNTAGKAAVYISILYRIFSAIYTNAIHISHLAAN